MLPSSTVENYLKAICLAETHLGEGQKLVPMGQLASALAIAPGTATTMVRSLSDAGLVVYEPYNGVRLTAAGQKLAARVIRRHRLIELFLVQEMGMNWDEVHDDAEQMEHVVSDRLIELIDRMLGYPTRDPHGDPIPTAEGTITPRHHESLLTCPLSTPLRVTRVADQDPAFLRFIESNGLKPGQAIEVESRDAAADSVRLRQAGGARMTIGARAASKVLVEDA
jgi:DtxR family Mn-dependent transcriptional regulator